MAAAQRGGDHMEIVRALQEKKPVPEIDFSLHTMEDGSQVSTQERVCKGRVLGCERRGAPANLLFQMFKLQHTTRRPRNNFSLLMTAASQIFNS